MIRPVMRMGEPVLMQKAVSVTDFESPALHQLVADMWDTMDAEGGIGIAAPQIGVSQQIVCFGTYESECAKGALHVPRTVDGLHARVVQHECDHLKGILYPMRVTDWTRFGYQDVFFRKKR